MILIRTHISIRKYDVRTRVATIAWFSVVQHIIGNKRRDAQLRTYVSLREYFIGKIKYRMHQEVDTIADILNAFVTYP